MGAVAFGVCFLLFLFGSKFLLRSIFFHGLFLLGGDLGSGDEATLD